MKHTIYILCYYSGITGLFYWINRKVQRILNYHHIMPSLSKEQPMLYGYCHSVENFKVQLSVITAKFKVTTEFGIQGSAVITFDDGARNNLHYAIPVLDRMNLHAYFFSTNSCMAGQRRFWVDFWYWWFDTVPDGDYCLSGMDLSIHNRSDRYAAQRKLWTFLTTNYHQKKAILDEMDHIHGGKIYEEVVKNSPLRFDYMNDKELQLLSDMGHFVGNHSNDHDVLSCLSDASLKEAIGHKSAHFNTTAFAIPFGDSEHFNEAVLNQIFKAGYRPILLNAMFNTDHKEVIGRLNLPDTGNRYEIHAHLSGLYHFIKTGKIFRS